MYLSNKFTAKNLVKNANAIIDCKKAGNTKVVLHGITFDVKELGYCQKNVRKLIEATVWSKERMWKEARCCASATSAAIAAAGYQSYSYSQRQVGDLVYIGGTGYGSKCSTCGRNVGHTGVIVKIEPSGKTWVWQNTSFLKMGTCIIPIRNSQIKNIIGIYRLLPSG